jgi:EAL domain-containing protein (putative c-di-GMP-specific phosphodiesterase class I)
VTAITPAPPTTASINSLREERDRFVALAFSWADVLLELDADARVAYAAGALEVLVGRSARSLIGVPLAELVPPALHAHLRELLAAARRRERINDTGLAVIGASGQPVPIACSGYHLAELNGHYFLSLRSNAQERKTSGFGRRNRDETSGLLDTGSFIDAVTRHLSDGIGEVEQQCSLLVLSGYDDLRTRLTDKVEHELLTMIGGLLRERSVNGDMASRLAEDRYALLHDDTVDLGDLASRISSLTRNADPEAKGLPVAAASVEMDIGGLTPEQLAQGLLHTVDRFRTTEYHELSTDGLVSSISDLARDAVETLNALQQIIANSAFSIAFQPVLDARTGSVHHYEALARFPDAPGGRSPLQHITLAEESGIIVNFDLAMIGKVVEWMKKNLYTSPNGKKPLSINLSGRSINSLAFIARIDRIARENPWIRQRLIFEVTELTQMNDLKGANNFIQRLREQGFFVSIDGFGSGAAHFSYLASLDVDMVKFAGSAIRDAVQAHKGKAFLRALVDLCRELGVATVAEHIEDETALMFVRECGIHYVQGYLFGEPSSDVQAFSGGGPRHLFAGARR